MMNYDNVSRQVGPQGYDTEKAANKFSRVAVQTLGFFSCVITQFHATQPSRFFFSPLLICYFRSYFSVPVPFIRSQ